MSIAATALPVSRPARAPLGPAIPRLIAGIAILALWEGAVRGFMPDFVAKPSGIVEVLPPSEEQILAAQA